METTKLTLSMPKETVERAHQLAQKHHTSVSAMFTLFIDEFSKPVEEPLMDDLPPLLKKALSLSGGKVHLPPAWDYRDELSKILCEKFGVK